MPLVPSNNHSRMSPPTITPIAVLKRAPSLAGGLAIVGRSFICLVRVLTICCGPVCHDRINDPVGRMCARIDCRWQLPCCSLPNLK
ncbi:unknown protein [Desulfotalea psychrophila LSv54]|uniref:Uncharacterized protein n=1 Tax=Desulfotalea psychrophila (strain LSv54 / DSM 12343) TaxID=177439 RepID=Q6AKU5_DESPS|nr:unknown protein [Desulfotalea psychrophila LSv54]